MSSLYGSVLLTNTSPLDNDGLYGAINFVNRSSQASVYGYANLLQPTMLYIAVCRTPASIEPQEEA